MKTTEIFAQTADAYSKGFDIIANKGGSRSSKTFSELQLLYTIMNRSKRKRIITVVSHSLPHLEGGAIRDFDKILEEEGITPESVRKKNPYVYRIGKSLLEFVGFDRPGKALGAARDILFINEANKMPFNICHQLMQRTTECIFLDWNPSEEFWFDTEKFEERKGCKVIKSNFMHNLENLTKRQLLEFRNGYRKALDEDIKGKRGYWWNWWQVYGLGLPGQLEGVIFNNWTTFEKLPENRNLYRLFVVDWGGTHPTSLSQLDIDSDNKELYITEHVYIPQILNAKFIQAVQKVNPENHEVICDAARSDKIWELQNAGINAMGSKNVEKLIIPGIELLQEYSIFVKGENVENEFKTYKWAVDKISGKPTGKPEDANNHIIDAVRYGIRFYHRVVNP